MPYLTPDDVPESTDCRALLIPQSTDWLAIFSGALTELTKTWNWEQAGITVDEAIAVVNEVLTGYYEGCTDSGCLTPDGFRIVRLNPDTWRIEELVNGEWVEPIGDYAMPPTPPREEPTPEERRCLAAANAVNALHTLYENLADSWGEALSLEDAINAFLAALIGIIGTAFGLPVAALIAIFIALMKVVYETIEFVTADLWDEEFTDRLQCMFYDCATDDEDVVHFDIQCIINKIGEGVTFDWTLEPQLRLLLQVSYLLNTLGAQAIDAAGATTAISSAVCDDCHCTITLEDPCGYGLIEHLGGTRWRITAQFVTTNYAVCVGDVDGKCWGYCNIELISGAPDYQDFTDCVATAHVGQPSGCNCEPDTGQRNDIVVWFMANSSAPFVIELDAFCHEDCG